MIAIRSLTFALVLLPLCASISWVQRAIAGGQPEFEEVVSGLTSADEGKRSFATTVFAKSHFIIDSDPRGLTLSRTDAYYGEHTAGLRRSIDEVSVRSHIALKTVFIRGDDEPAAMYAGAILATTCDRDDADLIQVFREYIGSPAIGVERRLIAYAGIMNEEAQGNGVMCDVLRAWSRLPASVRGEIWSKLQNREFLSSTIHPDDLEAVLSLSDDTEKYFTRLIAGIRVLGQAAALEATTIVGIGRGMIEAPGILRATAGDFPVDVRCFAIRLCSNWRIACTLGRRLSCIHELLGDESLAVRCAAAQTLLALGLEDDSKRGTLKLAHVVSKGELSRDETVVVEELLRKTRTETELWIDIDDLPEERVPAALLRSDNNWVTGLKYALAHGNVGQRRLAVARATDKVFSTRRGESFRKAVRAAFADHQEHESHPSVVSDIHSAIQMIDPFIQSAVPR